MTTKKTEIIVNDDNNNDNNMRKQGKCFRARHAVNVAGSSDDLFLKELERRKLG